MGVIAREPLNTNYSTVEYARAFCTNADGQFSQYEVRNESSSFVKQKSYRYTGLYYDAEDLQRVAWVDAGRSR